MPPAPDITLTPDLVIKAYLAGVFPMSDARDDPEIFFVEPKERGVIILDEFHVPKRLGRFIRSGHYTTRIDTNFPAVIKACARREETWINDQIEHVYNELFKLGYAHSVETYDAQNNLVGGLYGIALGGVFFGESMFSTATDASKTALVTLVEHLKARGFRLLDTQFQTDHLAQFGTKTMPQHEYLKLAQNHFTLDVKF